VVPGLGAAGLDGPPSPAVVPGEKDARSGKPQPVGQLCGAIGLKAFRIILRGFTQIDVAELDDFARWQRHKSWTASVATLGAIGSRSASATLMRFCCGIDRDQ